MAKRSVTASLVQIRGGALQSPEHVEAMMDEMGLIERRTKAGALYTERVLKSIEMDREQEPTDD